MPRNVSLDILRIIACLMVVAIHSPMPSEADNGLFLSSISYLAAPSIGLFFMISGALLLPINASTNTFLKRRFSKIATPTLIWSILYLLASIFWRRDVFSWKALLSLPFSAQWNPTFWFLYTLMGLYLLAPIVSGWLQSASMKEQEFFLILWGVTLLYPIIRSILYINTSETGVLYYFTGYAGYFLLGHYLNRYPERIRFKWLLPLVIIAYVVPVVCKLKSISVDFYSVFWCLSIFVVIQCVFVWKLTIWITSRCFKQTTCSWVSKLAKLSFGVYLIHYLIIRYLLWNWAPLTSFSSYIIQTLVIVAAALFLSFSLTFLVSLLPGSKYLIGTNNTVARSFCKRYINFIFSRKDRKP